MKELWKRFLKADGDDQVLMWIAVSLLTPCAILLWLAVIAVAYAMVFGA